MRLVTLLTILPLLLLLYNLTQYSPTPPSRRYIPVTNSIHRRRFLAASASAATTASAAPPPAESSPPPAEPSSPPPAESTPPPRPPDATCDGTAHMELWGSLVQPGNDNIQPTAADCCQSCRSYEPTLDVLAGAQCNTWVWHPETHHCWLKHQKPAELQRAAAGIEARRREDAKALATHKNPWHSGVWLATKACSDCVAPAVYNGCIGKDRCNTSRACGSPAIDGYAHVVRAHSTARAMMRQPTP